MLLIALLSGNFATLIAQPINCGVEVSPGLAQAMGETTQDIEDHAAARSIAPPATGIVPIRFIYVNGPGFSVPVSQGNNDFAINKLNQAFAPANLEFVQCGNSSEFWDDRFQNMDDIDMDLTLFAYSSNTLEIYVKPGIGTPYAAIPCNVYEENNPNYNISCFTHENFMRLQGIADFGSTVVHEAGHHFGLLHTWFPARDYNVPVDALQTDHPYPVPDNVNPLPDWWGRELVIRQQNSLKQFQTPNFDAAGDLVEDTPADCANFPDLYPGCPFAAQSQSTCLLDGDLLTYQDYNGDKIFPAPTGYNLGRNYMSYWHNLCLNEFTPKQFDRVTYFYDNEKAPLYKPDRCGTFTDRVEYHGTSIGLHNVTVRMRHSDDASKCNITTSQSGDYSGLLATDNVMGWAYRNGKKSTFKFSSDQLKIHFDHTPCEWRQGVDAMDAKKTLHHILNNVPFTDGYQIIAADVSKNNVVTTFDVAEMKKLILGIYQEFPAHEQPWRYIPEFIPQDYAASFNNNPFNLPLIGADYLNYGWQYNVSSIASGKRGWDGMKIGDVDGTWQNEAPCPPDIQSPDIKSEKPLLVVPNASITTGDTVKLVFKANEFTSVEAFQLGIHLPKDTFQVLGVNPGVSLGSYQAEGDFAVGAAHPDALTTVWINELGTPKTLTDGTILFEVTVKMLQSITNLQSHIALKNEYLNNTIWQDTTQFATQPTSLFVTLERVTDRSMDAHGVNGNTGKLHVSPNPATNFVNVSFIGESSLVSKAQLKLINSEGLVIEEQLVSVIKGENNWEFEGLDYLEKGIYTVVIVFDDKQVSAKLIKH